MTMIELCNFGQEELEYVYESGKMRVECHPEIAEKYRKMIEKVPFYKDRDEAIKIADTMRNNGSSGCQVWAKVCKDIERYYVEDYYIVSSDNFIKQAADYIGMEQIF